LGVWLYARKRLNHCWTGEIPLKKGGGTMWDLHIGEKLRGQALDLTGSSVTEKIR